MTERTPNDPTSGHGLRWRAWAAFLAVSVALAASPLALPLAYFAEHGVSLTSVAWVRAYFVSLPAHLDYWLAVHRQWIINSFGAGKPPLWLAFGPALGVIVLGVGIGLNPHSAIPAVHGAARWATRRDVQAMRLLGGFLVVLGRWRGRLLKLPETLSVLCVAPPGTGKTVAVVVPTILDGDGVSMVINDVKPELHLITSGHRRRLGPVFRLDWAALDDPEQGIVHPRWNPLSPRSMPTAGPPRDLYIDRLVHVLIPDPQGSADPHWSRRARAALAGFVHFIADKCAAGNRESLPAVWHGKEPCFAMLLDWITEATLAAGASIARLEDEDPNAAMLADPVRNALNAAIAEARTGAYAHRAIQELTQLANTPDRERGSILSAMDSGIAVFKNAAVRERTATSDFSFADLRGMADPETGRLGPATVYLCVNQQDARALGVVTGLFAMMEYLHQAVFEPGDRSVHDGL